LLRLTIRAFSPLLLLLFFIANGTPASAQGLSTYFGAGSANDSAATSPGCSPRFIIDGVTGNCEAAPTMGGAFGVFGADFMILPHLGVNAEYAFRFAQAPYLPLAGLNFRPAFYDFNAVWQPFSLGRIVPVVEGGFGGARIALYQTQTVSITGISSTTSSGTGSANHFQEHAAVGIKLYITGALFIKPQFDFHYVPHLTDQFGRNWVPQYTASVGYTFGGR